MHDHAIARRHEVDDLAHRGGFLVTGDNKSPGMDLGRIMGLIEEGPDVARAHADSFVASRGHRPDRSARFQPASGPGAGNADLSMISRGLAVSGPWA